MAIEDPVAIAIDGLYPAIFSRGGGGGAASAIAATITVGSLATLNTTTTLLGGLLGDDNPANYVKAGGTYAIASGSNGVTMPTNGEIVIGATCKATINASIQLQKDPLAGTTSDRYGICFFKNGSPIGNPSTINIEDLTKPVQCSLSYSRAFTSGDVLTVRIAQKAGSSADNPLVQRMAISIFGL